MPITKEALDLAIKAVEQSIARIDTGVLIFGSLVAIGVTGETVLGIRHWIKDRQLRDLRGIESQMYGREILGLQGEISGAKASADQLKAELANATEEAKRQAEELKKQNLQTQSDLLTANQNLEGEKRKRVELAASMLDRDFFDQSGAAARLALFPPMSVIFEYIDEHEPKKMAEEINFVFESLLHWNTWRRPVNEETIKDGISISVGWEPASSFPLGTPLEERFKAVKPEYRQKISIGERVAEALRDGIKHCGIDAESGGLDAYDLPPTTLLIKVGRKPNHALEETLRELGPHPNPAVVGGRMIGGCRDPIPQQKPDAGKNKPQ